MFTMGVKQDLNFWILMQIILRNQKQDLEISLQLVTKAIKEMTAMSQIQRKVLDKLLPYSLLMTDEKKNPGKVEEPENAEKNLKPPATEDTLLQQQGKIKGNMQIAGVLDNAKTKPMVDEGWE